MTGNQSKRWKIRTYIGPEFILEQIREYMGGEKMELMKLDAFFQYFGCERG